MLISFWQCLLINFLKNFRKLVRRVSWKAFWRTEKIRSVNKVTNIFWFSQTSPLSSFFLDVLKQTTVFDMTVFGLGHSIFAKALKKNKPSQKLQEKYFPKSGIGTKGSSYEMTISGAFLVINDLFKTQKTVHQICHSLTTHNQAMPATPLYPEPNMYKIQEKSKNSKQQNFSFHHKRRRFRANMSTQSDLCTDFALAFCLPSKYATTSLSIIFFFIQLKQC